MTSIVTSDLYCILQKNLSMFCFIYCLACADQICCMSTSTKAVFFLYQKQATVTYINLMHVAVIGSEGLADLSVF